jgi:hypothetical protein
VLIKWMHHANALGECADPAFVVAVGSLPEDELYAQFVRGLANNSAPGSGGWLHLSHDKTGSTPMWKHYFLNVCLPMIATCKETHKPVDIHGEPCEFVLDQDGEALTLAACQDPDVLQVMEDLKVVNTKGEPSSTELKQPLDVASTFRDTKLALTEVEIKGTDTSNTTLEANLIEYWKAFKAAFPA